jgi:hypothetical protein
MAEGPVPLQLGHMADFGGRCWTRVAMAKGCSILGWFGIRDAIDGWRTEARSALRSVFDSSALLYRIGLPLPHY